MKIQRARFYDCCTYERKGVVNFVARCGPYIGAISRNFIQWRLVRHLPHRECIFTALMYPLSEAHVPTKIIVDSLALVSYEYAVPHGLLFPSFPSMLFSVQRALSRLCNVRAVITHPSAALEISMVALQSSDFKN